MSNSPSYTEQIKQEAKIASERVVSETVSRLKNQCMAQVKQTGKPSCYFVDPDGITPKVLTHLKNKNIPTTYYPNNTAYTPGGADDVPAGLRLF